MPGRRSIRHTASVNGSGSSFEEVFGWVKTIGLLRKLRHRGGPKVGWIFIFTAAIQPGAAAHVGAGLRVAKDSARLVSGQPSQ